MKGYIVNFIKSLGGWLYVAVCLLILIVANFLEPILQLLTKNRVKLDTQPVLRQMLEQITVRLVKVSLAFWMDLCDEVATVEDNIKQAAGQSEAEWKAAKHSAVDAWLINHGVADQQLRDKLIQAAVWQRKIKSLAGILKDMDVLRTPSDFKPDPAEQRI